MKIDNIEIRNEALRIAEEALVDIELSRIPLSNIALKASRLARLVNEFDLEKIFEYEVSGYPFSSNGVTADVFRLGKMAERNSLNDKNEETITCYSISVIEANIQAQQIALAQAHDRNVQISSANPCQIIHTPPSNFSERTNRVSFINNDAELLSKRRAFIHKNIKKIYMDLKFNFLTESIWFRIKGKIDSYIREIIPDESQKISAIYDSLNDDNPEKWATALTTCRRMLKALADKLYPSSNTPVLKGKNKIKVGEDSYINRLILYIEENSTQKTLDSITNSNLEYIGKRLDNIKNETCKGTHSTVEKEEAERCFMHVYMLIGDILEIERHRAKVPTK